MKTEDTRTADEMPGINYELYGNVLVLRTRDDECDECATGSAGGLRRSGDSSLSGGVRTGLLEITTSREAMEMRAEVLLMS